MKPFPEEMLRPPLVAAFDLGATRWEGAFQGLQKTSRFSFLQNGKHEQALAGVYNAMERLGIRETRDVVVCHEIGHDGLWIRDWFEAHGFACVLLSPDVLSGNAVKAKTDRLDAESLGKRLCRFFGGDLECDHVHLPPPPEILEAREASRARDKAVKMRTQCANSIRAILSTKMEKRKDLKIREMDVDGLRDPLGRPLPQYVALELKQLKRHFLELDADVAEWDRLMREAFREAAKERKAGRPLPAWKSMVLELARLKGIGVRTAWSLVCELFYKTFGNTGQVGSATGLVAVPRCSGSTSRCAGISRRSSGRLRKSLVELAWLWIRYQRPSPLTQWFLERTGGGVSARRMKKVAIVAVARKLAVALWRHLARGVAPEGVLFSAQ